LRILEAVRLLDLENKTKIYQASTSELYGLVQEIPQKETTPFYPRSPYAVAKMYAYWITVNYREAYNIHASNGILFNHESPIRGETFVTRKITRAIARISLGMQDEIYLGNLNAQRDWGHAKDYVRAMYLILQQDKPSDYVIATGITTTIRDFILKASLEIGLTIEFSGKGRNEIGFISKINKLIFEEKVGAKYYKSIEKRMIDKDIVFKVDPKYYRPTEVDLLIGDPSKSNKILNWTPEYDLISLIKEMMNSDVTLFKKSKLLLDAGYNVNDNLE